MISITFAGLVNVPMDPCPPRWEGVKGKVLLVRAEEGNRGVHLWVWVGENACDFMCTLFSVSY